MKIRHAIDPINQKEIVNAYVAFDHLGLEIGNADVLETMHKALFPTRPLHLQVRAHCSDDALFALMGAATTRALVLARRNRGVPARIFTQVDPNDKVRMDALRTQGYVDNDGLMRMTKDIGHGPLTAPLPKGCVAVADDLSDDMEDQFFIERYNTIFSADVDVDWLNELKQRPYFRRFLLVAQDGLAGELLTWADGNAGVVGAIQTPPHWRRKGVASYLLDLVAQYWADMGLTTAYFDIWLRLQNATRLAEACGFQSGRLLKKYPGIDVG